MTLIPALATFFAFYVIAGYLMSVRYGRNDIVDMMWGPGIVGFAWIGYIFAGAGFSWIVPLVIAIWALRLSFHIASRMSPAEDPRYAAWRRAWTTRGPWYVALRSFLQVFVLQGVLMVAMAFPAIFSLHLGWGEQFMWWHILGLVVWFGGFVIEALADWQLADFIRRKHAGLESAKFLTTGLWGWSRHPNYFGEVVQWWGIWVLAIVPGIPLSLVGIVAPLLVTFLILKVSGVPMLEEQFVGDPEYEEYKKRVGRFFPVRN